MGEDTMKHSHKDRKYKQIHRYKPSQCHLLIFIYRIGVKLS